MKISEIKKQAKQDIKKNHWNLVLVELLNDLVSAGASMCAGVGELIVGGPMSVGVADIYKKNSKDEAFDIKAMFGGFNNFGKTFVAYLLSNIYLALWSMLFVIPGLIKVFAYSMVPYLQNDDKELGGNAAITKSRQVMNGHKGQLFWLNLSFIGWALLSACTGGILWILYVGPYYRAAEYRFYESISEQGAEQA